LQAKRIHRKVFSFLVPDPLFGWKPSGELRFTTGWGASLRGNFEGDDGVDTWVRKQR
jgi:hypothetical protein